MTEESREIEKAYAELKEEAERKDQRIEEIEDASRTLGPTMLILKELLLRSRVNHVDETGARIKGLLHWFHVSATSWLTFYAWHRKRGKVAMDEIGLLPNCTDRAIHDRLSSYDHYLCAHSICGAHLLRDCLGEAALAAVFEGTPFPIAWEPGT